MLCYLWLESPTIRLLLLQLVCNYYLVDGCSVLDADLGYFAPLTFDQVGATLALITFLGLWAGDVPVASVDLLVRLGVLAHGISIGEVSVFI